MIYSIRGVHCFQESLEGSFEKTPYIVKDFDDDPTTGFAQFQKEVNEEDVQTVQEKVPKIGENAVTWSIASGEWQQMRLDVSEEFLSHEYELPRNVPLFRGGRT